MNKFLLYTIPSLSAFSVILALSVSGEIQAIQSGYVTANLNFEYLLGMFGNVIPLFFTFLPFILLVALLYRNKVIPAFSHIKFFAISAGLWVLANLIIGAVLLLLCINAGEGCFGIALYSLSAAIASVIMFVVLNVTHVILAEIQKRK